MENNKEEKIEEMIDCGIPDYMTESLYNYIYNGIHPGGFLTAVLNNNLKGAFSRADTVNSESIRAYLDYLYNYAPANCHGFTSAVRKWIENFKIKG